MSRGRFDRRYTTLMGRLRSSASPTTGAARHDFTITSAQRFTIVKLFMYPRMELHTSNLVRFSKVILEVRAASGAASDPVQSPLPHTSPGLGLKISPRVLMATDMSQVLIAVMKPARQERYFEKLFTSRGGRASVMAGGGRCTTQQDLRAARSCAAGARRQARRTPASYSTTGFALCFS